MTSAAARSVAQIKWQIVFWIAAFVVFAGLLWLLSPILLPFELGLIIAYAFNPAARWLTKRGINRPLAAFMVIGGFFLAIVLLCLLILPHLWSQVEYVVANLDTYEKNLQDLGNSWAKSLGQLASRFGVESSKVDTSISDAVNTGVQSLRTWLGSVLNASLLSSLLQKSQSVLSTFSLLVITPVVAFYLICDWDRMLTALDKLIPLRQRDTVRGLCREIDKTISAYVRGQSGLCLILGSYYVVVLSVAELNAGLLIGIVSGILSFIPYVGSLFALVASLIAAMVQTEPLLSWKSVLLIGVLVVSGQVLESWVLSPKLVGHSVGLSPVWLMFALIAFGYVFHFKGLVLAVPLAAAAGVLTRHAVRRYRESSIYTGERSA